MPVMMRHAHDDLHAYQIANGMEAAGANVISITYRDTAPPEGMATLPHARFIVWAKTQTNSQEFCDKVDEAIDKEME